MERAGMNVLFYPHSMELGGSQLNAVQMAGAIRDRGHEVVVLSEPGPLVERVKTLGLEHIEIPARRGRPSANVAGMLGGLVRRRNIRVVHGHEWPPIMEASFGLALFSDVAVVGTVMSMSVAPFLPRSVPLTVGTELIRHAAIAAGHQHVALLEPPVDTQADNPSIDGKTLRATHGVQPHETLIVMVCRLVPDLKLEGLLAACTAVGELAIAGKSVRLMIIGDGTARDRVAGRAASVNAAVGRETVLLTGEMADPRPGYAAADIVIGQGGSALRGMAFAKPLIVIGEDGFSELLTPESAPTFLRQGWYGLGTGSLGRGVPALRRALERVIDSPGLAREAGLFGRQLTQSRFSLEHAAEILEETYLVAVNRPASFGRLLGDLARSTAGLTAYKLQRRYRRWIGTASIDDGNARDAIAAVLTTGTTGTATSPSGDAANPSRSPGMQTAHSGET
jgi:glycosyltransferase involved in cell wall biosynthesis